MMAELETLMTVTVDGVELRTSRTFWRGEGTRFRPTAAIMRRPSALAKHVLSGWMPDAPIIDADTTIVAFGSCFAQHVSAYLNTLGYDVATSPREGEAQGRAYITEMGDGIVNTYAIRQQFEWAWQGRVPSQPLWHGYKAEAFGYDEEVRLATRALFDAADVFIITLGLSEIWYDEPTGEVFWRAVPQDAFDPARHKFRVASAEDNRRNLAAVHAMIRAHRPDAAIIFTVSPIPLSATFRQISPFTANSVSKANLRSAVDELMREQADDAALFYYPSYEVVSDCFAHPLMDDLRHPYPHILDLNMKAFERYFCATGLDDADVELAYLHAMEEDHRVSVSSEADRAALHAQAKAWNVAHRPASLRREKAEAEKRVRIEAAAAEKADRVAARDARLVARGKAGTAAERDD